MTGNAFILNFFKLYNMLWRLCLPFLKTNTRLKPEFDKRISCSHHSKADIWIQAASAGEAYLAANIMKKLSPKKKLNVLVTATTSQGIDILQARLTPRAISKSIDLKIEWFPFDMPDTIKKAIKIINPGIMVLLETEIWPALLYYLKQNQTKIFIINARLSKKSYNNFSATKFLWRSLAPDTIIATSNQDALRYERVFEGSMVDTMPNIKFESMDMDTPDVDTLDVIKKVLPQTLPLTIIASIRKTEEKQVLHIIQHILTHFPDQVVAIFPRHMHRIDAWKKRLISQNLNFHLRSKINFPLKNPGIILWDRFGELKAAYGFASVVFVGGSLKPLGGQNFIEPAIQGPVIVTGPYFDDFAWATNDIFKKGIVIKKKNGAEVAQTIIKTLKRPASKSKRRHLALEYLKLNHGGTLKACNEILKAFDELL
ncbi:3-deoxy-D-manno-octulosonic acid transferase [Desulfobacula sp.]